MQKILDLFERDPRREIEGVIKVTDHDPARVWVEMEEYVATDEIKGYLRDIIGHFLESRRGSAENVCIWISGFFGSGKSHFLKVLAYLLEDRPLKAPDGQEHRSATLLSRKLGLDRFVPMLTRELATRVLTINLLDHDPQAATRPTVSRLVYRALLFQKGLSSTFWVAAWEQEFQQLGLWDEFRQWVRGHFGRSWEEERRMNAEAVLRQALPALLGERYQTQDEARVAIEDSKASAEEVRPSQVAQILRKEAEEIDPVKGRIVVLLDEVGLYIGDSTERLGDLNQLAEQVVLEGRGKVWLMATAQEALVDLVARLAASPQTLEWLKDRFRLKFGLGPANVERVVCERLLRKRPRAKEMLRDLFMEYQGKLVSALGLQGVAAGRLGGGITAELFAEFYPLAPYAVSLLREMAAGLRSGGGPADIQRQVSGRERSMLKIIHAVLRGEGDHPGLVNEDLGRLATFDVLFNALGADLRVVKSEQFDIITNQITRLGEVDGLAVSSVAKALFLIQQVGEWVPCTAENVAALLFSDVPADPDAGRKAVREALKILLREGWVQEHEGKLRLLTPTEHDFERQVRRHHPSPNDKWEGLQQIVRDVWGGIRYEHGKTRRPFDLGRTLDGAALQSGTFTVHVFSPMWQGDADLLARSALDAEAVFWRAADDPGFERLLEETLAIEKALGSLPASRLSKVEQAYIEERRRHAEENRRQHLPVRLKCALLGGRIYHLGSEHVPKGSELKGTVQALIAPIADRLFPEFVDARPQRDEDILEILRWRPGGPLPPMYTESGLVSGGSIRPDSRSASLLLAELKRRQGVEEKPFGKELIGQFGAAPFGWHDGLVLAVVAALFKNGNIVLRHGGKLYDDPSDRGVARIFGSFREFNGAVIELLPEVNWREANEILQTVFGEAGGDTFERTAQKTRAVTQKWKEAAERLATRARDVGMPEGVREVAERVASIADGICGCEDQNQRLRRLLENEGFLRESLPAVSRLRQFEEEGNFDRYRDLREFLRAVEGWVVRTTHATLFHRLRENCSAGDFLDRWDSIWADAGLLEGVYLQAYADAHVGFEAAMERAEIQLRAHPAFTATEAEAMRVLQRLLELRCPGAGSPDSRSGWVCPGCRRTVGELSAAIVGEAHRAVERALDALLVREGPGAPQALRCGRTMTRPEEADELADKLREYIGQAGGRPVEVELRAEVRGD